MTLLERIEKHLKDHHISATRFGRRAVGDPRFVLDLRMGRRPRRRTIERLEAYLASIEATPPECIRRNGK
jgi:2,4-dienoyl-CoA reductase-like NADH-dependent reductase (Old Yellow Enzyme family)